MKLFLVNQHYPPDNGATGRLMAQLAEAMASRGHDVTVLTGRPTYAETKHHRPPRTEIANGVRVVRLPLLGRRDGAIGRVLHYFSFAVSMLLAGLVRSRPDAILAFSSTPMFGGPAALVWARLKRTPFVYVVQDVYPEIAEALGAVRIRAFADIARVLETFAWRGATRLVVIGDEMRAMATERGVDERRLVTIRNWADVEAIRPLDISAFRCEMGFEPSDFVVEYAGNFGRSQDLETVFEAARLVQERAGNDVQFLLIGDGSGSDAVRRQAANCENVRVASFQPQERLADVLAAADLSLVPLRAGLTRYCVPSKIYSILASGRPVGAAIDADSEVARLVDRGECGFRVDPDDAASMATEILRLAGDRDRARRLGRNGRSLGVQEGSLGRAVTEYEKLLTGLSETIKESGSAVV